MVAVLPDGHEIEGVYYADSAMKPRRIVHLDPDGDEYVAVRTVKPLPVPEPTEFGARVVDTNGFHYVRASVSTTNDRPWRRREDNTDHSWTSIRQPVTVVDADPTWEAK